LGENIHVTTAKTVSDGTYIGFIVLMFCGAVLATMLCDASKVQREDGSHVVMMKSPTWKSEFIGLFETFKTDTYIIFLFPMFFASNWFYTYQFNSVNNAYFNTRTRALNNTLYWCSQIFGAFLFGYLLDIKGVRRSVKAKAALAALLVITMAIWGGGYAFLKASPTRAEATSSDYVTKDFKDSGYVGSMFMYMFYGFYDAAWQTSIYWYVFTFSLNYPSTAGILTLPRFMGALSNSGRKTANFAGFYKGIQSAGASIISAIDSTGTSYSSEFGASWGLLAGSIIIAAPTIFLRVKDHVNLEDDLKFSDETLEDVLPPGHNDVTEKQVKGEDAA
jgi:hypothetical protein